MKGTTNSQRGTGGGGEKLVISLRTNQASHEDLIGAKFSVVINGNATEYTWQGASITIPVPPMLSYTVEFGEVERYTKPESVTHTAVAGNDRFVTGTYNTELVTVNVSAEEGEVSGYEIQIISDGNVLYTQTTPSASYKIPYGTSYTIKASEVNGYTTPPEQSFTASQSKRNVKVVYQYKQMGVFTVDANGNLGDKDTPISNGVAVAVITENVRIMFNTVQGYNKKSNVGNNNISYIGDTLRSYDDGEAAKFDYDGENNNRILYNAWANISGSDSYGVMLANVFKFNTPKKPNGRLPSLGELVAIYNNYNDVNTALTNAGIANSVIYNPYIYWSTTRHTASDYVYFYKYTIKTGSIDVSRADYLYNLLYVTSDF